jgi:tetratricopeptide (TPR) repeat protein
MARRSTSIMRRSPANRRIAALLPFAALILAAASPGPKLSAPADPSSQYDACLAEVAKNPQAALDRAGAWRESGGGFPAEHCAAVALIGLKRYDQAARRLEALAGAMMIQTPELRAATLEQAGQAWLLANDAAKAKADFDAGLSFSPHNPDLLIDRAEAYAAGGQYWEAIDDLNRALESTPDNVTALIYRASAYRNAGGADGLELGLADVERALKLSPNDVSGLLERGNILRLRGDVKSARTDWERVVRLEPGSTAAADARNNLAHINESPAAARLLTNQPSTR